MGEVGNTCFYNSLLEGLRVLKFNHLDEGCTSPLQKMMEIGGWNKVDDLGKMVCTETHAEQIQQLAELVDVCICLYTEVVSGYVDLDHVQVFGKTEAKMRIRIVKVYGVLHYNLITSISGDESVAKMYENAYYNNKRLLDDETTATAEVSDFEKRIVAQEATMKALQAEITSWGDALTAVGSDASVELHLRKLFAQFRDAHDALVKLLGNFAQ